MKCWGCLEDLLLGSETNSPLLQKKKIRVGMPTRSFNAAATNTSVDRWDMILAQKHAVVKRQIFQLSSLAVFEILVYSSVMSSVLLFVLDPTKDTEAKYQVIFLLVSAAHYTAHYI